MRIAVFVDGENISAAHAEEIRKISQRFGQVDTCRVYGNLTMLPHWASCPGYRAVHSGVGKNATDILLTVDAMDFAFLRSYEGIVIVSADRDFTHPVQRLREHGKFVLGLADSRASEMFRAACSTFHELKQKAEVTKKACETVGLQPNTLDEKVRSVISANSMNGRGMYLSRLATCMHKQHGVKIRNQPEKTWRAYLGKRPLRFELDPRGPEARVRFKPDGFKSGPASA